MNKEQMQRAIILADRKAQQKKQHRLYKSIAFFGICIFFLFRIINPGSFLGDFAASLFLGGILGFIVPGIIAAYQSLSGVQVSYPEDYELNRLLALYEDTFGENFIGPWSH